MVEEEGGSVEGEDSMETNSEGVVTEKEKKYYFDTVNINVPRKGKEIVTFLKDGMGTRSIQIYIRSLRIVLVPI